MLRIFLSSAAVLLFTSPAVAGTYMLSPQSVTEWKPVYAQVETRDRVPARARIGGTIVSLDVSEGDHPTAGARIALIHDTKLGFQIDSYNARLAALASRLDSAKADLERGNQLKKRGVMTTQRLEVLETAVSDLEGEISSLKAERMVVQRQVEEGEVLVPEDGIILEVPVSIGSVVTAGESIAVIGGGGVFLRLSVPERHATDLAEGDAIEMDSEKGTQKGVLVKLYPQISAGRVQADVEVAGLDANFIGRRVLVRLPVGTRQALLVPESALSHHGGLDYVTVETGSGVARQVVVPGDTVDRDGQMWREILSGLTAGDKVLTADE